MKKAIKIVIAGIVVVSVIVVAIIVKQHISITSDGRSVSIIGGADGPTSVFLAGKITGGEEQVAEYTSITMDEAKDIFMTEGDYIILDVRRADEFAEGHIPGAINVANEDILNTEPAEYLDSQRSSGIAVSAKNGNYKGREGIKINTLFSEFTKEISGGRRVMSRGSLKSEDEQ